MAYRSTITYKEKSRAAEPRFIANMRELAIARRAAKTKSIRSRDRGRALEMED